MKKTLAVLLSAVLAIGILSVTAFAKTIIDDDFSGNSSIDGWITTFNQQNGMLKVTNGALEHTREWAADNQADTWYAVGKYIGKLEAGTTYKVSLKAMIPDGSTELENVKLTTKFTPYDGNDRSNLTWVNWIHNVDTDISVGEWTPISYTFTPEQDYEDVAFSIAFDHTTVPDGESKRITPLFVDDVLISELVPDPERPEIPKLPEEPEDPEIPEKVKRIGWFMTGEKTHAMIIGRAIITLPHKSSDSGYCDLCGYNTED